MEVIRIGEHKMKIKVNSEEAERYSLYGEECKDGAIVRKNLWALLAEAKKHSGLDPEGDKLLIQFYPTNDGGCEIFVTRLGVLSEASARLVCTSERVTVLEKKRACYAFDSPDAIISLKAAIIKLQKCLLNYADVYRSPEGTLFLILDEYGKDDGADGIPEIFEFARQMPSAAADYVEEHFAKVSGAELDLLCRSKK